MSGVGLRILDCDNVLFVYLGGAYLLPQWQEKGDYAADFRNLHHENEQLRKDIELLKQ